MPESHPIQALRAPTGASGLWEWDIASGRLYTDDGFADLYGIDRVAGQTGVPAETFFRAIHPEDRSRIRIAVAGILSGAELFSKEFRLVTPQNVTIWVHARGRAHINDDDVPQKFTGVLVDVTDRKKTEERLRIAQTAGGIGTFEYVDGFATATISHEFCRLLGLHPALSLPVQTINSTLQPGQPLLLPDSRHGVVPETIDAIFRITRNDDGASRWIARRGEILREGSGFRLIGVIYDVTDAQETEAALRELNETLESRVQSELVIRHRAVDALRQAQKMESIGQLTGGIAHDFNNLLMAISSSLELLKKRLPNDPQYNRLIDNAQQATERGAGLTQRMLAFARKQDLKSEPVDVAGLIGGMTHLLRHTLGPAWTLAFDLPGGFPSVVADANQVEMAIINLTVNARDAMADGGTIRVTTDRCQVMAGDIVDLAGGEYIRISVHDEGEGMDAETLQRATEPFFTTKGVGKGTGLGLSMVDGLAKQMNGTFTLRSTPGQGTSATLWLPVADDQASVPVAPTRVSQPDTTIGPLKILAVDDDALILMNTTEFLQDLGHQVVEALSGKEALALLDKHPDIDLIITDQAMPNMTGLQLVAKARERRADLPVLIVSGYGEIPQNSQTGLVKLDKPFNQAQLSRSLHDALAIRA